MVRLDPLAHLHIVYQGEVAPLPACELAQFFSFLAQPVTAWGRAGRFTEKVVRSSPSFMKGQKNLFFFFQTLALNHHVRSLRNMFQISPNTPQMQG
jgi:hypothetical protein